MPVVASEAEVSGVAASVLGSEGVVAVVSVAAVSGVIGVVVIVAGFASGGGTYWTGGCCGTLLGGITAAAAPAV